MTKLPALFVGHGSPMNALEPDNLFNRGFSDITRTFAKPKAVLMISAHWYSGDLQVTAGEKPPLIYDFYGFPEALSQVQYPAPGSPALARQIAGLLAPETVMLNPDRGFDHGMWAVMKYLYPNADIPVVQLSLNRRKNARWHFDMGKKLAPLREQGVLIIGSGNIVHNLRLISREHLDQIGAGYDWAHAFQENIKQALINRDEQTLIAHGDTASLAVPTPEHYLPLLYIMALRDEDDSVELFNDALVGGSLSMTSVKVS